MELGSVALLRRAWRRDGVYESRPSFSEVAASHVFSFFKRLMERGIEMSNERRGYDTTEIHVHCTARLKPRL